MRARLVPSILIAFGLCGAANARFKEIGPLPLSQPAARERIKTLIEKVDPGNRQETIKTLSDLAVWYRYLLDEELIAAWKKEDRAKLTGLMALLADSPVAVGVVAGAASHVQSRLRTDAGRPDVPLSGQR